MASHHERDRDEGQRTVQGILAGLLFALAFYGAISIILTVIYMITGRV